MPRPGFVLEVDRSTPPDAVLARRGLQPGDLPADRSRVIYPPEPLAALDDIDGAIRHALAAPDRPGPAAGAAVPRHAADDRLRRRQPAAAEDAPARHPPAGHRGRARPRRRRRRRRRRADRRARPAPPDDRGRAAPRHRRPHLRRLRAARPADPARRRGPRQPRVPRHHAAGRGGRDQQAGGHSRTCSSTSTSTSSPWTAGGSRRRPGLASYRSLRHHHNPATMEASHSFMDQHRSELHKSNWRMGKVLVDAGVKVFQIETTLNTDTFPPAVRVPVQAGVGVDGQGPGDLPRHGQVAVAGARRGWPARSSTRSRRRTR